MTYLVLLPLHTGLARDVTDTDCWGQNVGRDLATLKRRMLTNRSRNRAENLCMSIFYSIPIDRTREASSLRGPPNVQLNKPVMSSRNATSKYRLNRER